MDDYIVLEGKKGSTNNGALHVVSVNYRLIPSNGTFQHAGRIRGMSQEDFKQQKDFLNGKWTALFSYIPLVISEKLRNADSEETRIVENGLEALCSASPSIDPSFVLENDGLRKALLDSQMVTVDVYIVRMSPGHIHSQSYAVVTRPNEGPIRLENGKMSVGNEVAIDLTELQRHIDHKSSIFFRNNNEVVHSGSIQVHRRSVSEPNLTYDDQRIPLINHKLRLLDKR